MYVITYSLEDGAVDPAARGLMLSVRVALVVVLLFLLRLVRNVRYVTAVFRCAAVCNPTFPGVRLWYYRCSLAVGWLTIYL